MAEAVDFSGVLPNFIAPAAVTVGIPIRVQNVVVLPLESVGSGQLFSGLVIAATTTKRINNVPKVSAQAWAQGQHIYWDNAAANFTTTVGSNQSVGFAARAAANPSSVGDIIPCDMN